MTNSSTPSHDALSVTLPETVGGRPGSEATFSISLTDGSGRDRHLLVRVVGSLTGALPATHILLPAHRTRSVPLTMPVPHGLSAGDHRFLVEVVDRDSGSVVGSAESVLSTLDTRSVSLHISPPSVRKRRKARVRLIVRNHDEVAHRIRFRTEPDEKVTRVDLARDDIEIRPGEMVRIKARVRVRPFFMGKNRERWYSVIGEGPGLPVYSRGNVRQRALVGQHIRSLMGLMCIVLVWAGMTLAVIRAVSPVTTEATAGAEAGEGDGSTPGDGGSSGGGEPAAPVDVTGTVTAMPDGSGVVVTWRAVSIGDVEGTGKATPSNEPIDPNIAAQQTVTDEKGNFAVTGLDGMGLYQFTFAKQGHTTQSVIVQPEGKSVALEILLVAGDGVVSGTTVDSSGQPIGGITLSLTDGVITYTTTTPGSGDGVGQFTFRNLSTPGTYILDAVGEGLGLQSTTFNLDSGASNTGIVLTMSADLTSLSGTIDTVLFGSAGRSAQSVSATSTDNSRLVPAVTITATDGVVTRSTTSLTEGELAGSFRLEDLPVNRTYTVTYSANYFTTFTEIIDLTVDTPARSISLTRSTGRLVGTVTVNGSTVPPTSVAITITNPDNTYKSTDSVSSSGALLFDGITPGRYTVVFEALGLDDQIVEAEFAAGVETRVNATLTGLSSPTNTSSLTFTVKRDSTDAATVFVEILHRAADDCGAVTGITPTNPCTYGIDFATGETSKSVTVANLAAGAYLTSFTATGYSTSTKVSQLSIGQSADPVEVILEPLGTLSGQVTDDTGSPVQGLAVNLLLDGDLLATSTTNDAGEYKFDKILGSNEYTVQTAGSAFTPVSRSIAGAIGATINVDITARALSLVIGDLKYYDVVTGKDLSVEPRNFSVFYRESASTSTGGLTFQPTLTNGVVVAGATVTDVTTNSNTCTLATSARDCSIAGLPFSAARTFRVSADGYADAFVGAFPRNSAGDIAPVLMDAADSAVDGSVAVRVLDAITLRPLAGASVVRSNSSAFCAAATDQNGNCVASSVGAGNLAVVANLAGFSSTAAAFSYSGAGTRLTLLLFPTWVDASQVGLVKSLGAYRLALAPLASPGYDICLAVNNGFTGTPVPFVDTCTAVATGQTPVTDMSARLIVGVTLAQSETATRSVFVSPTPGSFEGYASVDGIRKANIKVEANRVNKEGRIFESMTTFTDANGKFVFESATPTEAGTRPASPPACDLNANNATHTCWYVRASVDGVGVSIWSDLIDVYSSGNSTIPSDVNIASSLAQLSLTFIDDIGMPVPGLSVSIKKSDNSGTETIEPTNAQGVVVFDDLLATKWKVTVNNPSWRAYSQDFTMVAGTDSSDTVKLNSLVGSVKFVVSNSGSPLGGAIVKDGTDTLCTTSSTAPTIGVCEVAAVPVGLKSFTIEPGVTGVPNTTVSVAVLGSQTVVANAVLGATEGGLTVGVYETNGDPVAGVAVVVTPNGGASITCAGGTNVNGTCTISGLSLGSVSVSATKDGFLPMQGTATVSSGGGSISLTAVSSRAISVFVVEDEFNQPVSGALVTVTGTGVVGPCTTNVNGVCQVVSSSAGTLNASITATGYVDQATTAVFTQATVTITRITLRAATSALSGTVTSSGNPVSGAIVLATGPFGRTVSTTADASGAFTFPALFDGVWKIRPSATGYAPATDTSVTMPSATSLGLQLTPLNGTVRFVVMNRTTPVNGAAIVETGVPTKTCTTDTNGTCTIPDLAPGVHRFTVSATGVVGATTTIEITSAQTVTSTVVLGPDNGGLLIAVHDVGGAAVNNATVSVTPNGGTAVQCTTVGGRCSISGLAVGTATVSVSASGFSPMNGEVSITDVGASIAFVAFNSTGTVGFAFVDEMGAPVSGVSVAFNDGNARTCTTTSPTGTCSVANVIPGTHTATATVARFHSVSIPIAITAGSYSTYRIPLVAKTAGLTGLVRDELAQPVKGALVTASGPDGRTAFTHTDTNGEYAFTSLVNGSWSLIASASGYTTGAPITATVEDGTTPTANITLPSQHGTLSLQVRTPAGAPATGLTAVVSSGSTTISTKTSDSNGHVSFGTDVLTYGTYTVHVSDASTPARFQSQSFVVNIDRGSRLTLSIYMATRLGSVFVAVAGIPAEGMGPETPLVVNVGLRDSSNATTTVETVLIGTQRVAQFFDVPPGNYTLHVDAPGSTTYTATSIVLPSSPGTTYGIPPSSGVTVPTAGSVNAGTLLLTVVPVQTDITVKGIPYGDPAAATPTTSVGSPTTLAVVSGARVELSGGHLRTPVAAQTNGSGVAELGNVPPGTYSISVRRTGTYDYDGTITITDKSVAHPFTATINVNNQTTTGSLEAVVHSDGNTSNPVAGATVSVVGTSITCITDSGGKCVLPNLSVGSYTLRVAHPRYVVVDSAVATVTAGITKPVSIGLGATTGSVEVLLIDSVNGAVLSGATFALRSDPTKFCTTTAAGTCTVSSLPLGNAVFEVAKNGFETTYVGTTVTGGTPTAVPVSARPSTGTVTVHVRDAANDALLDGATVALASGGAFCSAVTSSGSCTATGIAVGAHTISATKSGFETQTVSINHTSAGTSVTINLAPTNGAITFAPVTTAGAAITGATVTKVGDNSVTCTASGTETSCTIGSLHRSPHTFKVTASGHADTYLTATPVAGTSTVKVVMGSSTGTVTVHVRDAANDALLDGVTVALASGGAFCSAVTSSGSCTATGIAVGAHTISATKSGFETQTVSINHTSAGTSVTINLAPTNGAITFAPVTTAGAAITGATVTKVGDNSVTCTASGTETSCTIGSLHRSPHTFKVTASGHADTYLTATPVAGTSTVIVVMSNAAATTGTLEVRSVLASSTSTVVAASIDISGTASTSCTITSGTPLCTKTLAPGPYEVRFTESGYETVIIPVTVVAGSNAVVIGAMRSNAMTLTVNARDIRTLAEVNGATVKVNGVSAGTTSGGVLSGIALALGSNTIEVSLANHITATAHVHASYGMAANIVVYLVSTGSVTVTLSPGPSGNTTVSIGAFSGSCTVPGSTPTSVTASCSAVIDHVPYGTWIVSATGYASKTIAVGSASTAVTLTT